MTPPSTSAVVGTMWRRILERLFPKLRPAFKSPEELSPDYPEYVLCAISANGFPVCGAGSDGEYFALASLDSEQLAEQYKMLVQVNAESNGRFAPLSIQLLTTDALIDRVKPLDGITGIAVCGDKGQIIYTR